MHFEPSSVMTEKPSPEEVVRWQRRLAGQANNRAWSLSEQASRSAAEDEEMLNAAHAAMYFWSIVGNANNQAHAVAANVASARGNTQDHKRRYQEATRLTAALENAEERAIIEATLRVLPVPTSVCTSVD
jgi:hypothetical protein